MMVMMMMMMMMVMMTRLHGVTAVARKRAGSFCRKCRWQKRSYI